MATSFNSNTTLNAPVFSELDTRTHYIAAVIMMLLTQKAGVELAIAQYLTTLKLNNNQSIKRKLSAQLTGGLDLEVTSDDSPTVGLELADIRLHEDKQDNALDQRQGAFIFVGQTRAFLSISPAIILSLNKLGIDIAQLSTQAIMLLSQDIHYGIKDYLIDNRGPAHTATANDIEQDMLLFWDEHFSQPNDPDTAHQIEGEADHPMPQGEAEGEQIEGGPPGLSFGAPSAPKLQPTMTAWKNYQHDHFNRDDFLTDEQLSKVLTVMFCESSIKNCRMTNETSRRHYKIEQDAYTQLSRCVPGQQHSLLERLHIGLTFSRNDQGQMALEHDTATTNKKPHRLIRPTPRPGLSSKQLTR